MKKLIYIMTAILGFGFQGLAQPANDFCSGAQTVTPDGSCVGGTTVDASDSWTGTVGCQSGNNPEVWYTFTATGTQLDINLTAGTMGGDVEFVLVQATGACSGLTLEGSECGPSPLTTSITGLQVGATYYYTVSSSTGADGTFTSCVDNITPPPVPGQDCTTAAPLCDLTSFSQGTFTGVGTVEEISNNSCFGGDERQSKWYTFTADQDGTFEWTLDPDDNTDDYDWAIWNTTNGCYTSGTTMGAPIACNWSGCPGNTGISTGDPCAFLDYDCTGNPNDCVSGQLNTTAPTLTAGETYTILIDNFSSNGNGFSASFGGTAVEGPNAEFAYSLSANCMTITLDRTPHYTGSNMTYTWNFGDGSTSTSGSPGPYTYTTTGTYTVSLEVTDANGCIDTYSETVNIGCIVLPIELTKFTADYKGDFVDLNWETTSERENDYFTVEKSYDGKNFKAIGTVDGAGNSSYKQSYNMKDYELKTGIVYYRLKQTDFNGETETFNTVYDNITGEHNALSVYPNPAEDRINVGFSSNKNDLYKLRVYSASGEIVYESYIDGKIGVNSVEIGLEKYRKGLYFIELTNDDEVLQSRFVKK